MLSSIDVYRAVGISHGTESGPPQETPLTEESELRRNPSPYPPQSIELMRRLFSWVTDDYDKIPAEREVMSDPELPGTVLRLPMIYGPEDRLHRLYAIVKRMTDGRRHIIFPNKLAAWRSPRGYVLNVATAVALATTDQRATGRVYNICEEPPYSELEWARKIASEMGWDGEFILLPEDRTPAHLLRPGDATQHWAASSGRIRRELGFKESVGLEDAIRETVRWELDNPPSESLLTPFDYAAEDAALLAARPSA
jgi:nucleoside-diphosphate-sugar epimerase